MAKKNNINREVEIIFCAYADGQEDFVEHLKQAKNIVNRHTKKNYRLNLWEDMNSNGKFIIENIRKKIGESDYFICELSKFNWNVFFELGYAIGYEKPVKLFLKDDSSIEKEFRKLKLLYACGYETYNSKEEIKKALSKEFASQDDKTALKEFGKQFKSDAYPVKDQLLIIANTIEEQPVLEIQEKLDNETIPYKYNNSNEAGYRTREWYKENISQSYGVIIHLSSQDEIKEKRENAENSFIAGICDAIGKPYMFIGHSSIKPPMDYQEHFASYDKEIDVKNIVDTFLEKSRTLYLEDKKSVIAKKEAEKKQVVEEQTRKIDNIKPYLNFIAEEEESDKFLEYFVENQFHKNALDNQGIKIIVGRKGTGKTALFIKLKSELSSGSNSITAILNPDKSDFRDNIELLSNYESNKEKILLTIWEIVILSTLCRKIKEIQENKPHGNAFNDNELIKILDRHQNIGFFKVLQGYQDTKKFNHVLQIHREPFYRLIKEEFDTYIKNKKYLTINIIADNLDCIWDEDVERDIQASIIKSLVDFAIEFKKRLQRDDINIEVNFCFFLREDIFVKIKETVKFEIDKFEARTMKMDWSKCKNDLKFIVDKRFSNALGITSQKDIEKAWLDYFELTGKEAFDKILKHIIARPRDLLKYLSNLFLSSKDGIIRENDFIEADKDYRSFIYDNMKLEIHSIFNQSDTVFDKITKKFDKLYEDMEGHEFIKTIDNEFKDKEESFKFLERLIELDYLTCIINNKNYRKIEEIRNKFKEKKMFFFRKNAISFRFK